MNGTRRAAFVLMVFGFLLTLAPASAQSLSADDAALWHDAAAATFGAKQLSYQYDLQVDIDGLRKFALGANLQGQGQIDRSGALPRMAFDAAGDLRSGSAYTTPVDFQTRLIDGTLYLNDAGAATPDWQMMPLAEAKLTVSGGAVIASSEATFDLGPLAAAQPSLGGFELIVPGIALLNNGSFFNAQRLPDANGMAQFRLTLDPQALITAAAFVDLMKQINQTQGNFFGVMDDAGWTERTGMLASFFSQATLTVTADVDPVEKVIRHLVIEGSDLLADADQALATSAEPNQLHLDLTFDSQPQRIDAPADARTVDALTLALDPTTPVIAPGPGPQLLMVVGMADANSAASIPLALKAGQTITLAARTLSLTLDFSSVITLLAPDGSTAAENDYYEGETPSLWLPEAGIDNFNVPADGRYQAQVADYDHRAGPFLLTVYVEG